jgi:uncharacterized tellurite resistance protein B-like protein
MFNIIQRFFGADYQDQKADKNNSTAQNILVATCALLVEMAQIDGDFSEEEKNNLVKLLKEEYELSEEHIQEITRLARLELENSHDLWRFTNLINENYNRPEKLKIIELVWEVIYSDGKLNKYEDHLVHKLARLLNLQHSELIEAKLRVLYKDQSE